MAHEFVQTLDQRDPDAILNADLGPGNEVSKGSRGEIVVKTKDGEMSWASAVKTGLIKLSGRSGG